MHYLGAETAEGQKVEENVQFGPVAPVALPVDNRMWVYGGLALVAAYALYTYFSEGE